MTLRSTSASAVRAAVPQLQPSPTSPPRRLSPGNRLLSPRNRRPGASHDRTPRRMHPIAASPPFDDGSIRLSIGSAHVAVCGITTYCSLCPNCLCSCGSSDSTGSPNSSCGDASGRECGARIGWASAPSPLIFGCARSRTSCSHAVSSPLPAATSASIIALAMATASWRVIVVGSVVPLSLLVTAASSALALTEYQSATLWRSLGRLACYGTDFWP